MPTQVRIKRKSDESLQEYITRKVNSLSLPYSTFAFCRPKSRMMEQWCKANSKNFRIVS